MIYGEKKRTGIRKGCLFKKKKAMERTDWWGLYHVKQEFLTPGP